MGWQNSLLVIPLVIAAFWAFFLASQLNRYLEHKITQLLSVVVLAVGAWSLIYAFEIWSSNLQQQVLLAKLEYLPICIFPPFWLQFAMEFRNSSPQPVRHLKYYHILPFAITFLMVITNDLHHLFWVVSDQLVLESGVRLLSNTYGIWFWVHTAFSYIYLVGGAVMIFLTLFHEKRKIRESLLIAAGMLFPLTGSMLYVFKFSNGFDWTPILLTVSASFITVGVVRFKLFDVHPLARMTLFSSLNEPIVFVDTQMTIIEANPMGEKILKLSVVDLLAVNYEDRFKEVFVQIHKKNGEFPLEVQLNLETGPVFYEVNRNPVKSEAGHIEGYLLTFSDITILKQIEQAKIEEAMFFSLLNEISVLALNSNNIDEVLYQVVDKIHYLLQSDICMVVREIDGVLQLTSYSGNYETADELVCTDITADLFHQVQNQRSSVVINATDYPQGITRGEPDIHHLLAYPLVTDRDFFGILLIGYFKPYVMSNQNLVLIEHTINQTMLSISRLQVLTELEQKVAERTNQLSIVNVEMERNLSFLQELLDSFPNPVFVVNQLGELVFYNDLFKENFIDASIVSAIGYSLMQVLGDLDPGFYKTIEAIARHPEHTLQTDAQYIDRNGLEKDFLVIKSAFSGQENSTASVIFILVNISHEKSQERSLKESENRYQSLFESMPIILFEEDHSVVKVELDRLKKDKGEKAGEYLKDNPEVVKSIARSIRVVDCNRLALDFYQFESKEELFAHFPSLISSTAAVSYLGELLAFLEGKTTYDSEVTHTLPNGMKFTFAIRMSIPEESQSDFKRVLVSMTDISKRKMVEAALTRSEKKFRGIIEQSVDGIVLIDNRGKIIEWNNAAEKITGYPRVDLIGRYIWDIYSLLLRGNPDFEEQGIMIKAMYQHYLLTRVSPWLNKVMENDIQSQTGEAKKIASTLFNIDTEFGNISCSFIRDITAEKTALAEVQKLAIAVHAINEGLVITNNYGVIEYVNNAFEQISGYPSAEVIGQPFSRMMEFGISADDVNRIDSTASEQKVIKGKAVAQKKDGTSITMQYNISQIVDESGRITHYVGVLADVSADELNEQQNRQAQKLEAIGSLAAGVAHEINTPTQYVGNNLLFMKDGFGSIKELLQKNADLWDKAQNGGKIPELIQQLREIEKSTDVEYLQDEIPVAIEQSMEGIQRVTKIVQAIKEFSHPSMDEKVPVDLNRAIETTVTVSHNEWKYVSDLETHFDPTLPAVVCSPGEINQVILNLITNGAHAISDQIDKNIYKKGLIKIYTYHKGNEVEIRISDNGGGIPEAYRERVFDPFFTTKPVGKGTGQGLSIAHKVIVDKHQGRLSFESVPGEGTTFVITLPIESAVQNSFETNSSSQS